MVDKLAGNLAFVYKTDAVIKTSLKDWSFVLLIFSEVDYFGLLMWSGSNWM